MRRLVRLLALEVVSDAKLSRFAAGFGWVAAAITLVLGYRYVGQLGLQGPQHLLGLAVLLILCLVLGSVGTLGHAHAMLKTIRDEARASRGNA